MHPFRFNSSCCKSKRSISTWFHSEKKNRVSQFGCLSIIASRHGEHAALPTKAITRSNFDHIWYTRWEIAVLFPDRRLPTAARTTGSRSCTRSGFHI